LNRAATGDDVNVTRASSIGIPCGGVNVNPL